MKRLAAGLLGLSFAGLSMAAPTACRYGVYGEIGKSPVAISNPTSNGADAPERYTFVDGRRGDVNGADGLVRCAEGAVSVRQADGNYVVQSRVALRETPTRFKSHGTELAGMLIEPAQAAGKPPLVVFVHGSEKTPGIGGYYPYVFAAEGLAVFAYDKRGTGASGGDYTQNFELLADDAAAALGRARKLADGRYSRAGFFGGSQGGWVAPRAAALAHADYVAVGFGLVMTPLEEDQQQVVLEMKEKGYDDASVAHAREVADAAGEVMASHFTGGYEQLAAAKRRYASEPWLHKVEGEFTGELIAEDESDLRRTGAPRYDNLNILWRYDAVAALRALDIPQLWVLAGEDREAPDAITQQRLIHARASRLIFTYFPAPTMACTSSRRTPTARVMSRASRTAISACWPTGSGSRTGHPTVQAGACPDWHRAALAESAAKGQLKCARRWTVERSGLLGAFHVRTLGPQWLEPCQGPLPNANATHELALQSGVVLRTASLIVRHCDSHHDAAAGKGARGRAPGGTILGEYT